MSGLARRLRIVGIKTTISAGTENGTTKSIFLPHLGFSQLYLIFLQRGNPGLQIGKESRTLC